MQSYHKYVTASPDDVRWGLFLIDVGTNRVPPGAEHPPRDHPRGYQFTWASGRILYEYQLIYLVEGRGHFESHCTPVERLQAGHAVMLFPEVWHRYRPDSETGWTTHWIGFRGSYADHLVGEAFFAPSKPVMEVGFIDQVARLFLDVQTVARQEMPGFQQIAAGTITLILGHMQARLRGLPFAGTDVERKMNRARLLLVESIGEPQSLRDVAEELNMSYSWFRKLFKRYTGSSPGQYQMQLRIQRARELLSDPDCPIKEIADALGFHSQAHLTRVFKEKVGVPPGFFRERSLGGRSRKGAS